MAKLKVHKRRRRTGLKRLAVVLLVLVALAAAALGIVTVRIRAILLSALKKQLPHCEVSVGRVTLNPLSHVDPFGTILLPVLLMVMGWPVFGYARPVPTRLDGVKRRNRAHILDKG